MLSAFLKTGTIGSCFLFKVLIFYSLYSANILLFYILHLRHMYDNI